MSNTCTQNDLVKERAAATLLWQLPWAAIVLASFLAPSIQMTIWAIGFAVMGVACLVNAKGCGRLHCFLTGPLYLSGAAAALLRGFDVITVDWSWILLAMILGTVLAYVPEWVRGQYVDTKPSARGSAQAVRRYPPLLMMALFILAWTHAAECSAQAQLSEIELSVNGLACPFCVHGIKKKVAEVDGVQGVEVSLKDGLVTITSARNDPPHVTELRDAITKSGFTPGDIKITAIGALVVEHDELSPGLFTNEVKPAAQ